MKTPKLNHILFSRKGCQTTQTGVERQAGKEVSISSNEMEEAEARMQKLDSLPVISLFGCPQYGSSDFLF